MKIKIALYIVIIIIFVIAIVPLVSAQSNNYIIDRTNKKIPIPIAYTVSDVFRHVNDESGYFRNPEDVFVDNYDNIFIADTGNNRVVKFDQDMKLIKIYTGTPGTPFNSPKGVYADAGGDVFIADTGNLRIVHLTENGDFVEEFTKPESSLLSDTVTFDPTKIYINSTGFIYMIKGQHFMTVDAYNNFKGYVGASKVGFSLSDLLIRIFASEAQIRRIARKEPDPYNNFVIMDDNMIYAVAKTSTDQIRKINAVGDNIFPPGIYGEYYLDSKNNQQIAMFNDIAVDKNGIITVLSGDNSRIYQYDNEGNMLACFGGKGNLKGFFNSPKSIAVNSEGFLYVVDSANNNLQVLKPTQFIRNVHSAVALYSIGKYPESAEIWRQVLLSDANYFLAHKGIAKALTKEGKFKEAMAEYNYADDRIGYSEAFSEYRHQLYREYFILIVIMLGFLLFSLSFVLQKLIRVNRKIFNELILKMYKEGAKK